MKVRSSFVGIISDICEFEKERWSSNPSKGKKSPVRPVRLMEKRGFPSCYVTCCHLECNADDFLCLMFFFLGEERCSVEKIFETKHCYNLASIMRKHLFSGMHQNHGENVIFREGLSDLFVMRLWEGDTNTAWHLRMMPFFVWQLTKTSRFWKSRGVLAQITIFEMLIGGRHHSYEFMKKKVWSLKPCYELLRFLQHKSYFFFSNLKLPMNFVSNFWSTESGSCDGLLWWFNRWPRGLLGSGRMLGSQGKLFRE